jgi:predicted patatin/cPLA2 family phospholipase
LQTKQSTLEADLADKRYLQIKNQIHELEKSLKIMNIDENRKMRIAAHEAQVKESELLDLLRRKEQ